LYAKTDVVIVERMKKPMKASAEKPRMIDILCSDGIKRTFQRRKGYVIYICTHCLRIIMATEKLEEHTCEFSPIERKMKSRDRWGRYFDFSGHEEKGHCFWCGVVVKNSRYCSKQHAYLYLTFYHWHEACINVYRRIYDPVRRGNVCEKCNEVFIGDNTIDIHHIIPVNGEVRNWNIKNRPENLLGLCKACHIETHRILFKAEAEIKKQDKLIIEQEIQENNRQIQPELFLTWK